MFCKQTNSLQILWILHRCVRVFHPKSGETLWHQQHSHVGSVSLRNKSCLFVCFVSVCVWWLKGWTPAHLLSVHIAEALLCPCTDHWLLRRTGSPLRLWLFGGARKGQMLSGKTLMESCMKHCSAAPTRLACALISFGLRLNGPAELRRCNDIMPSVRRCLTVRACALCDGAAEEADDDGQLTNPNLILTLCPHPHMQWTHLVT